jgi:hypothetical protein
MSQDMNGKLTVSGEEGTIFLWKDVRDITHVLNYDYPNNSEDYVHRIGRTASELLG